MAIPRIHSKTLETMRVGGGKGIGDGQLVPHFLLMRDSRILPLAQKLWNESGGCPDKYVRNVFEYITKNVGYAFDEDISGLNEEVIMPFETLRRGWSDCEDSAMLMVSLLTPKGVPSHMVLGYAGGGSHRWPEAIVDGEWYVFDTTNGDVFPQSDRERRGYVPMFYVTPHSFRPVHFPIPLYLP